MTKIYSTNPYLQALAEKVVKQKTDTDMAEWIRNNTTLKGKPFSFKNHQFQKQILNDMHPYLTCKKLSQVGLTEGQIRKALGFMCMEPGVRIIYTFPTKILKDNNSRTRIKPVVDTDFPEEKGTKEVRNADVIQIGSSFMYIASGSESDVTSTPADMVMNDEIDLGDSDFYALVNSRLQASTWKIKQSFSTPTFSGFGVSLDFESSDQHEYFVRCPHCNEWQVPLYDLRSVYIPGLPSYIQRLTDIKEDLALGLDLDSAFVRCIRCGHKLDLGPEAVRQWVPKYPTRVHSRGYQVRPFSSNLLSVKYLVMTMADYIKKGRLRRGYNTVLGEDYQDSNARMEETVIKDRFMSQVTPKISKDKAVYVGIDMGLICHITVVIEGAVIEWIRIGYEQLINKIKELDAKYNIVSGAIDRYPYTPLSNDVRDMTNGRIQPVVYAGMKVAEPKREEDKTISYIACNRTHALDAVKSAIYNKTIDFYGYGDSEDIIVEHLRDMVREDEPGKQPEWKKLNGNDHFFHSLGYALLAKQIKYVMGLNQKLESRSVISICGTNKEEPKNKKTLDNLGLYGYTSNYSNNRLF